MPVPSPEPLRLTNAQLIAARQAIYAQGGKYAIAPDESEVEACKGRGFEHLTLWDRPAQMRDGAYLMVRGMVEPVARPEPEVEPDPPKPEVEPDPPKPGRGTKPTKADASPVQTA